jgi:hypothetical protein
LINAKEVLVLSGDFIATVLKAALRESIPIAEQSRNSLPFLSAFDVAYSRNRKRKRHAKHDRPKARTSKIQRHDLAAAGRRLSDVGWQSYTASFRLRRPVEPAVILGMSVWSVLDAPLCDGGDHHHTWISKALDTWQ